MSNITQVGLVFVGVTLSALFGTLGSKLVSINYKTNWKWLFYGLGIITVITAFIILVLNYSNFVLYDYLTFIGLFIIGIFQLMSTKKVLDPKFIYKPSELNSIINSFTKICDRTEIKLIGGDLNFFGNEPSEMDQNEQYNLLKSLNFNKVLILCESPRNALSKIRYGKILNDINTVEFKFYNPEEADLRIRGRMKKIEGVDKLLIYTKIGSQYQAIETDTSNYSGALYNNIWKLIWSLATKLKDSEKSEYLNLYKCK